MCIQNVVSCSNKYAVINKSGGKFALAFSNVDQVCIVGGVDKHGEGAALGCSVVEFYWAWGVVIKPELCFMIGQHIFYQVDISSRYLPGSHIVEWNVAWISKKRIEAVCFFHHESLILCATGCIESVVLQPGLLPNCMGGKSWCFPWDPRGLLQQGWKRACIRCLGGQWDDRPLLHHRQVCLHYSGLPPQNKQKANLLAMSHITSNKSPVNTMPFSTISWLSVWLQYLSVNAICAVTLAATLGPRMVVVMWWSYTGDLKGYTYNTLIIYFTLLVHSSCYVYSITLQH